jgi:hypothetical protein
MTKGYAVDMQCSTRPRSDGTCTVVVEVTGLPSILEANKFAEWMRRSLREHVEEIGRIDRAGIGSIPRH